MYKDTKKKLETDRLRLIHALKDAVNYVENVAAAAEIVKLVHADEKEHFLSLSQEVEGKVSYASKPEHKYDNKRRKRIKLGRYIRKHLGMGPDELCDEDLHTLTSRVVGVTADNASVRIVRGEDIIFAYSRETGGHSCMTGYCNRHLIEMYADNPDVVGLAIHDLFGSARALVWNTEQGATVLDRVYGSDEATEVMRAWAEASGVVLRNHNGPPRGTEFDDEFSVTLDRPENYPYADSFRYMIIEGTKVHLYTKHPGTYDVLVLDCTDGDAVPACAECQDAVDDDSAVVDGVSYCSTCLEVLFTACSACGRWVERTVEVWSAEGRINMCSICAMELADECSVCGDITLLDDLDEADIGKVCSSCSGDFYICRHCGMMYAHDEYCDKCEAECAECGDYYYKKEVEDGVCSDCRKELAEV